MKITRGEIIITDVPTVDYIKVDTASNSVAIKFDFFGSPVSYDFDHLVELRDALTTARGLLVDANNAAVAETVGKSTLRVAIPTLPPAAEVGQIMAQLPPEDGQWLIQQIGGRVILFNRYTEEEIVSFDPSDANAAAIAQGTIANTGRLDAEQKSFAHFWSGYFYAYATGAGE